MKAGISKPIFPHAWRHGRATFLSNYFSESQMNKWFGWRPGSRMTGIYVHLSENHLEDAFYRMRGICIKCKSEKQKPGSDYCQDCISSTKETPVNKLSPLKCPWCSKMNEATRVLCANCARPLDKATPCSATSNEALLRDLIEKIIEEKLNNRLNEI